MDDLFKAIFVIGGLFMLGGTVIIFSVMMWQTLRGIFKGEW